MIVHARLNTLMRFNSIKVRLIRYLFRFKVQNELFQFHKGSINTSLLILPTSTTLRFNSIKVRLILRLMLLPLMNLICFNSIKVRLILASPS